MVGKIFIGNLPDHADGHDVEDFLRDYGRILEISLKEGYGALKYIESIPEISPLLKLVLKFVLKNR